LQGLEQAVQKGIFCPFTASMTWISLPSTPSSPAASSTARSTTAVLPLRFGLPLMASMNTSFTPLLKRTFA
jgi:hypothetical protein